MERFDEWWDGLGGLAVVVIIHALIIAGFLYGWLA